MKKHETPEEKAVREQHQKEVRQFLREISKEVKPLVESGRYHNINEAIVREIYEPETGQTEFHTFYDWRKKGKTVKKGQHGLAIWSRPITAKEVEDAETAEEDTEKGFKFFGIAYLFSAAQVHDFIPRGTVKAQIE
jgi:hypothetical protein